MLVERAFKVGALCAMAAGIALSCSVDHRKLKGSSYAGYWIIAGAPDGGHAEGGASGASYGGEGGATPHASGGDSDAQAGSGNLAGSSAQPPIVDGCPDLDLNGEGDCHETLVQNSNFVEDTQDWMPDGDAFIEWSPQNHFDDLPSGSAQVSLTGAVDADGYSLHAASQCVKDAHGNELQVYANVFARSGQGDGHASLSVFFYPTNDCSGALAGAPFELMSNAPDVWQTLNAEQAVPEGTHSALVRLAVTKPNRTESFKALFDNVLIRLAP